MTEGQKEEIREAKANLLRARKSLFNLMNSFDSESQVAKTLCKAYEDTDFVYFTMLTQFPGV